ncbi:cadherin-related family member 4-like [Colossoma macropomum]|uniref:cadherin-related family member 4-like n=1 Tax=Colossoma macropomum TaxID=42526 RepID=UPI00186475EE|nr:cadherin-related family member 4-like [Colossoma macropomum]
MAVEWTEFTITTLLKYSRAPGFVDLPMWVEVAESAVPGSAIVQFQIQSDEPHPDLQVLSVSPPAALFQTPIINPTDIPDLYIVQIMLNSSLDFERVRLYSVRLGIATASSLVQQSFHLRVIDVNEAPECETQFQFPAPISIICTASSYLAKQVCLFAGVEVRVPEDVSPYEPLYTVPVRDLDENDTISFVISEVLPASSLGQFQIDGRGKITSDQAFGYQRGPKDFSLSVVVRDSQGANCSGKVRIKVLKVFTPPLDFLLPVQNVSVLENGGAGDFVTAVQANPNISAVFYTFVKPYPPYKIGPEDGIIRTAYNLDLEADRTLMRMVLLVRALSVIENRSGTATITVHVLDVNEHPPFCSPPIILLTVPETTEVGRSLGTLTCVDVDVNNRNVTLTLIESDLSLFKFRLRSGQLQVNNSLDYDVEGVAANNFQYEAVILATDSGSPALTTEVQVLVTVLPVNEFDPQVVAPLVLPVLEDAQRGSVVGVVTAVDRDWPFNSVRLSIPGGDPLFSIDPIGGQLYLRAELDFEEKQVHTVRVQAVDFGQDTDWTNQRTSATDITIQVQNVNDNAPVCDPVSYESSIFSTLSAGVAIVTLTCTDLDGDILSATITNGAAVDRFQTNGLSLSSKNVFSFVPDGVYDETWYEVTVKVSDGKFSTDAVAYITVVPWTTTKPTTTTTTTTLAPQVVTVLMEVWNPESWFVVVLTLTGALLLLTAGLLTWNILARTSVQQIKDQPEVLLRDSEQTTKEGPGSDESEKRFDGKAQDPVSGRSYLFSSLTGERRWLDKVAPAPADTHV